MTVRLLPPPLELHDDLQGLQDEIRRLVGVEGQLLSALGSLLPESRALCGKYQVGLKTLVRITPDLVHDWDNGRDCVRVAPVPGELAGQSAAPTAGRAAPQ